ncbi:MAG: hypothetical protein QOD06_219 [Candidatus Binatota bacterium]|jgi:hypothetical protein|nr:hypothetical protein [Candidatus Binatota bacterium]
MGRLAHLAIAVAAIVSVAGAAAGGIRVDGDPSDWVGEPTGISGTSRHSGGEFIYTDYLYDAWGANVDGFRGGQADFEYFPVVGLWPNLQDPQSPRWGTTGQTGRFRTSGDFGYPPRDGTDRQYDSVADVSEVRIGLDAANVYYLIRTTALRRADQAVFAIGIDRDGNAATGGGEWPLGANLRGQLGFEHVLTVWGTGGAVTSYADGAGGADEVSSISLADAGGAIAVDLDENVIEVSVPRAALGAPSGVWRHWIIGGLWDAAASRWKAVQPYQDVTPGGVTAREFGLRFWYHFLLSARPGAGEPFFPNVYQVLFRPFEPNTWWRDDKQAEDLAAGSIASDFVAVDMSALGPGGATTPQPRLAGPLNLVNRSALDLGEGLAEETSSLYQSNYRYLWKEQPYSMLLPSDYPEDPGDFALRYFLHYLNGNQNNFIWGVEDCLARRRTHVNDEQTYDHVQALADTERLVVASTLARGEGVGYADIGEVDAVEVLARVMAAARIDPDRVTLMGMSMGASGTARLAPLYAERFNAAVSYSGATDTANVENLRNVPYVFVNGDTGLDAALLSGVQAYRDALAALGYEHAYFEFVGRAHDYSLVCDSKPLVDPLVLRPRDPNPARVTYRIEPAGFNPSLPPYSGAYWVSAMRSASGAPAAVDLTSHALAAKLPPAAVRWSGRYAHPFPHVVLAQGLRYGTLDEFRRDHPLLSRDPGWRTISEDTEELALVVPDAGNRLSGKLSNLASVTVDLARASLAIASPLDLDLDSSGATRLHLAGRPASSVTMDGMPFSGWSSDAGGVTVTLVPGRHVYRIG